MNYAYVLLNRGNYVDFIFVSMIFLSLLGLGGKVDAGDDLIVEARRG